MITKQEKAYRAHLRRAYKAKHEKKIGKSVKMIAADYFTDLYERRNPKYNGAWDAGHRPRGKWLRQRLELIKGFIDTLGWANML